MVFSKKFLPNDGNIWMSMRVPKVKKGNDIKVGICCSELMKTFGEDFEKGDCVFYYLPKRQFQYCVNGKLQ